MSNFDDALERFQQIDLEYAGGLSNHGPMGAEALESLGHQAKILAFVDIYAPRLPPILRGERLARSDRPDAFGKIDRRGDWVTTFETRVEEIPWRDVLAEELPSLLPGLFAAAGHGLLRVAHAVRALEREDTELRRRELAHGLAYWSARFQTLPGETGARAQADVDLEKALNAWPLLGDAEARMGFFFLIVRALDEWAPYAEAVEAVPQPAPDQVEAFMDALCGKAAKLYVQHPQARIAYVHALTVPSGLRFLLPYLKPMDRSRAAGFALQAVGALHSMFGDPTSLPEEDPEVLRAAGDWDEVRYHAACSIQEHAIKMTEACWREFQRSGDPIFERAGADAALQVGGRSDISAC